MAKYTATYTHEDDGWWTVRIKEVQGVHSQGRSISQARNRVREALSLFVDDAETAEIADDIKLPPVVRKFIMKVEAVTRDAERSLARMAKAKEQAARKLITTMSVRDAGAVLGVSHQRVQQLVKAKGSNTGRRLSGAREHRL
jgi:predicted RNase H-like HicB family nuclease